MNILAVRFAWRALFFTAAVFVELVHLTSCFYFLLRQIVGLNTNISFLSSLCEHGHFKAGDVHTDFIKVSSNMLLKMRCSLCYSFQFLLMRIRSPYNSIFGQSLPNFREYESNFSNSSILIHQLEVIIEKIVKEVSMPRFVSI